MNIISFSTKYFIIIGLLSALSGWSTSFFQNKTDEAIAFANYTYSHIMDTSKRDDLYKEEMLLLLGKGSSVFLSGSLLKASSNFTEDPTIVTKNGAVAVQAKVTRFFHPQELYLFHDERKFFVVEKIVNAYLYEENYPSIDWKISPNTKTINNLNCQEATTDFKGRVWTAWFCPDIPFKAGPWQFCGLPGLIVKAVDSKDEISFELTSFQHLDNDKPAYIPTDKLLIEVPKETNDTPVIQSSKDNIKRLWEAFNKNSTEFIRAQIRASGGIINDITALESLASKPNCNNPLELKND